MKRLPDKVAIKESNHSSPANEGEGKDDLDNLHQAGK
jgi:hypothetical protein